MSSESPKYWFPAKRYGWGWGLPATWQGWAVFAIWLALMLAVGQLLAARSMVYFGVFVSCMVVALVAVCYAKGEPPRWRWGDDPRES